MSWSNVFVALLVMRAWAPYEAFFFSITQTWRYTVPSWNVFSFLKGRILTFTVDPRLSVLQKGGEVAPIILFIRLLPDDIFPLLIGVKWSGSEGYQFWQAVVSSECWKPFLYATWTAFTNLPKDKEHSLSIAWRKLVLNAHKIIGLISVLRNGNTK